MKTPPAKTIDEYIAAFPREIQARLKKVRALIRSAAPDAEEAIKYQIPTFVLNGNLVHFAGYAKHLGLYPTPSAIQAFAKELSSYESAKGSVQFPHDEPLPLELIQKIVAFRVREAKTRAKLAKKKPRA